MSGVAIRQLDKGFGKVQALSDIGLEIPEGGFLAVLGPTNAGKTTLLKLLAGLYPPDSGVIEIGGRDMRGVQPKDRGVSLLFQNNALFPDRTGFENIAFPLRAASRPRAEIAARVQEMAALLRIDHLLTRYPRTFSGGEQQRVAIGRALASPAELVLLDEPLSGLDARLRIELRLEFKRLHERLGRTILYVTHDQIEAMSLASRIAVLDQGRLQQIGTAEEIYQRPRNRFVAEFIGTPPMNILPVEPISAGDNLALTAPGLSHPLPLAGATGTLPGKLAIGVRPEEIKVAGAPGAATPEPAEIVWVEHFGARRVLDLRLGRRLIKATVSRQQRFRPGETAWIGFTPQPHRMLDATSGLFLS